MSEKRIEPGEVWLADLCGHESRVRVISSHREVPELWVCERLTTQQGISEGMHILVASAEFTKLEREANERAD